jgi:putative ABC transport system permease protein
MIDEKYISTFNIKVTQGRNFELERIGDVDNVIVNEAFVRAWDWKSPLDEHVIWQGKEMKVIGVIKDFHFSTLYTAVEPLVLFYNSSDIEYSAVAFNVGVPVSDQVPLIQDVWANIFGNEPLEYRFFDESLAVRYLAEEKAVTLFTVFSILAIFISTLGLFGLCSLAISQRRKEIGVRKVLGAGSASIISLFLREYLPIIGLSFLFATPICIFGIKNWLSSFQHQGGIDSWVFFFVALCVIGLVLLAIVFSIVAAGRTSLAKLLRE